MNFFNKGPKSSDVKAGTVQNNLCEVCGNRPKYVERGLEHPFCSRTCAQSIQRRSLRPCALHGCEAPTKQGASFCSEEHGRHAVRLHQVKACGHCKVDPAGTGGLCIACEQRMRGSTLLQEISAKDVAFKSVQAHFEQHWQGIKKVPKVEKVIEITVAQDIRARYEAYQKQLPSPSEIRTYHSSQCICDLGVGGVNLCSIHSCGICNIVRSSFQAVAFGARHNTGSLGAGIYSYENPALADRFATSCLSSPYRVMIACDVAVASRRGLPLLAPKKPNLTEKPIFVEKAKAIIPVYLILYSK